MPVSVALDNNVKWSGYIKFGYMGKKSLFQGRL